LKLKWIDNSSLLLVTNEKVQHYDTVTGQINLLYQKNIRAGMSREQISAVLN